ncbi:anti-sigma regulatory factor (Ser/Thr protein kinase) [Azospirillum fermentarium]|uniref:ATP-binding protein n=1 Tax=Azospirillum fermentarium TaxID=1233114 RepID=UPI002226F9ED|nr:ATP-binding protein [Azospirillum fermentarium]MCW2246264.1 anti-sigma regulatory factor (Ser/Thr protein kinase) [Azospirillum fermentarium]
MGGSLDRDGLTCLLAGEAAFVVETDEGAPPEPAHGWVPVAVPRALFALSLSTRLAWAAQPAAAVCDALLRLGVLDKASRGTVELCLHEAVANAIVHGNLGIASAAKNHPEGYETFGRLLAERLADPDRRRLRLDIVARWDGGCLDILVADEGAGFDRALLPLEADGNSRSGRGFVFMRALAAAVDVTDGGRCTRLRFPLA